MSCQTALQIQPEEYLVDPRAPEWLWFREHFPGCPDCSQEMAGWSELEELVRTAAGRTPQAHPRAARLLVLQRSPRQLDEAEREGLAHHLAGCPTCRNALSALAGFDFEAAAAGAPGGEAATAARSEGSRRRRLLDLALFPLRTPAMAGLLLIAVAISAGAGLWWMRAAEEERGALDSRGMPELASQPARPPLEAAPQPELEIARAPEAPAPRPLQPRLQPSSLGSTQPEPATAAAPKPATAATPREPAAPPASPDPSSVLLAMASLGPPAYLAPPLLSGLVGSRIQEISRAGGAELPQLRALAPDHPGLSLRESPTLYWFISDPTPLDLRFSLIHPTAIDPVLELSLGPVSRAGIAGLQLEPRGVRLETGVRYRWFVSLSRDAGAGGYDLLSSAEIERIDPGEELHAALESAPPAALGHRYAEQGLWYDAFDFFSGWVEREDRHAAARLQRAALLEQVGLREAAAHDRRIAEADAASLSD